MGALENYALAVVAWVHDWQDLVAALIGAAALVWTVRWTLRTERRRRDEEAAAFRVALGVEARQLAAAALNIYRDLTLALHSVARDDGTLDISANRLVNLCQLPAPAVYSRGADRLGALGEHHAFEVVYFYGQLDKLLQTVRHFGRLPDPWERLFSHRQVVR